MSNRVQRALISVSDKSGIEGFARMLTQLGVTDEDIFNALEQRNVASDGGRVRVGPMFPSIDPTGGFSSEQEFRELLISEPGAPELIYLGNVADVRRMSREAPNRSRSRAWPSRWRRG